MDSFSYSTGSTIQYRLQVYTFTKRLMRCKCVDLEHGAWEHGAWIKTKEGEMGHEKEIYGYNVSRIRFTFQHSGR